MRKTSAVLLLSIWCGSAGLSASEPVPAQESQLKHLERRVQAVYASVKPAIVRVSREVATRQTRSGVIVREDGLVLTYPMGGRNVRPGERVIVHLAGGRRVNATALGWSNEWGVAMVKITEPGPWPHVPLGKAAALRPGEPCVALGYPLVPGHRYDSEPALRLGCITKSAGTFWGVSSCWLQSGDFGSGLFDLEGRLVGVTASFSGGYSASVHATTELVKTHWDDLAVGKNLDFVRCIASDKPAGESSASPDTPSQPDSDASRIAAATANVKRATVRLQRFGGRAAAWSGVIVTSDGYIITCAHPRQLPGEKLLVALADGRNVAASALGTNWIADIAMVKISEQGPWPCVPMGDSTAIEPQDPCLLAGYPSTRLGMLWPGRQPDIRRIKIADQPQNTRSEATWSGFLATAFPPDAMKHGDSGGGVFDLNGRVLAVNQSMSSPDSGIHGRVELFKRQWDLLVDRKPIDVLPGEPLAKMANGFRRVAKRLPLFAVEVLGDGKRVALGTVVRADGRILTKASELRGTISCRMPDGRKLSATVEKVSRPYDLAVVKVEAADLSVVQWSQAEAPSVGTLVSAIIPGEPPRVGVVCHAARAIPPEHGRLEADLQDSEQGLAIVDKPAGTTPSSFHKGDVIVHVEDHPTPNLQAYRQLLEPASGEPLALAGDRVRVGIRRGKDSLEVQAVLVPRESHPRSDISPRCTGFPMAFDADIPLASPVLLPSDLCGGPVIDAAGLVVGVAIACRPTPLVLPASLARKFLTD